MVCGGLIIASSGLVSLRLQQHQHAPGESARRDCCQRIDTPRLTALAVAEMLTWAGTYYLFPALLTHVEAEESFSRPALTATYTTALLASAAAAPLAGRLIDRGNGRALLTISAVFCGGVLILLSVLSRGLVSFFVSWVFLGVGMAGCLYEPCFALLTHELPDPKDSITLITLVAGFASTITFPACHAIATASSWRTATAGAGMVVACVAAPLFWLGAAPRAPLGARAVDPMDAASGDIEVVSSMDTAMRAGSKVSGRPPRQTSAWPDRAFGLLALAYISGALAQGTVVNHLLPIAYERHVPSRYAIGAASLIGPSQV